MCTRGTTLREVQWLKHCWKVALALVTLVPIAAAGRPVLFQDELARLTIDLAAGVPSACVIKPAMLRDPSTCEGVDLAMVEQGMGEVNAGSLVGQDRSILLVVSSLPVPEEFQWTKD